MAAPGFLEPAAKDFVITIQNQQRYVHAGALHQVIQFAEKPAGVEIAGTDVDADGDGMGKIPVGNQPADQGNRQIVYRLKAQVFQNLQSGTFSGPGNAGDQ